MAIDQTIEFQAILDILNCLEVTHQNQRLILEVITSHLDIWEQLRLKQRSHLLRSTILFLRESPEHPSISPVKSYLEGHLLAIS